MQRYFGGPGPVIFCFFCWLAGSVLLSATPLAVTGAEIGQKGPAQPAAAPAPAQVQPPELTAAPVAPAEVTELWTGGIFSSTYRVGICYAATGKARGVLHLKRADGKVDVYHFYGSIKNNVLEVSHSSGHRFQGRLQGPDRVQGVIHLKNGMNIDLEGSRRQDAPLVMEDCAPLPD